jgi:hypothetical protein
MNCNMGAVSLAFWRDVRWQIERYFAVAAFNRREARRERKRYPTLWRSHLQLIARDLALLHESTPELLDVQLIEDLTKARAEIAASTAKISAVITAAIAYLVLTTLEINIPISFAGLDLSPSPGVSEVMVLLVAVLSSAVAGKAVASMTLVVASKTLIRRLYPHELYYFRVLQFHANEPPPFYRPVLGSLVWRRSTFFAMLFSVGLVVVAGVAVLGASIAWRSIVYPELWQNPSADPFWCRAAVVTALLVDIGWVAYFLFYIIPLPHKDYAWLDAMLAAQNLPNGEALARHMSSEKYADGINDRFQMQQKGYLPRDNEPTS